MEDFCQQGATVDDMGVVVNTSIAHVMFFMMRSTMQLNVKWVRTVIATAREIIVDCTCYDLFLISFEHNAESVGSMTDRDRSRSREHPFSRSHGVASSSTGPNESSEATRGLHPIPINAVSGPVRLVRFQPAHERSRVVVEVGSPRLRISAERESIVIHI